MFQDKIQQLIYHKLNKIVIILIQQYILSRKQTITYLLVYYLLKNNAWQILFYRHVTQHFQFNANESLCFNRRTVFKRLPSCMLH